MCNLPVSALGQDAWGRVGANFVVALKAGIWSRAEKRAGVTLERGERERELREFAVSTLRERMLFTFGSSRTTAEESRGSELLWIF